jgi:hypothetical protein
MDGTINSNKNNITKEENVSMMNFVVLPKKLAFASLSQIT